MSLYSRLESSEDMLIQKHNRIENAISVLEDEGYVVDGSDRKKQPTFDELKKDITKDYKDNIFLQRFQNGESIETFVRELLDEMTFPKYWVMYYSKSKYETHISKVKELSETVPLPGVFNYISGGANYLKGLLFSATLTPLFFGGLVWLSNQISDDPTFKYDPEKLTYSSLAKIGGFLIITAIIAYHLEPIISYLNKHNYFKKRKAISKAKRMDKKLKEWLK